MYDNEILKERIYLNTIVAAMNKLLAQASEGKNKKNMKKQENLFLHLREKSHEEKFYKFWQDYSKKTSKNLDKLKYRNAYISVSKIEDALQNNSRNFNSSDISKIIDILSRSHDLKQMITSLSNEYKETLKKIENYKRSNKLEEEREKQRQQEIEQKQREFDKPKLTEEQEFAKRKEEEKQRDKKRIDENSAVLLRGPKNSGIFIALQGKDGMLKDMEYLYGLAMDILIIMEFDQHVDIKNPVHGKEARVWNVYFETIYDKKSKIEMILNAYGVNNIDGLLNKYEKMHSLYYKEYLKLSKEKQAKYNISEFDTFDISSSLFNGSVSSSLLSALQNEKLNFPPSKEKLISFINTRIMNGNSYQMSRPKQNEEVITGDPENYADYGNTKKYYKNLTKNMTIEEISDLYGHVVMDIQRQFEYSSLEPKDKIAYYALMQKMFCEVIFDKKEMKFADGKQKDAAMEKIAKEILKEDLKFSIYGYDKVSEEEKQERQHTIQEEYIKYRAKLTSEGKKEHLSFNEFAKQKYALEYVEEPKNLEQIVKKELKGMKK